MNKITKLLVLLTLVLSFSCNDDKKKKTENQEIIKPVENKERDQKNLLGWESTWTEGIGSVDGFKSVGNENESQRVKGTNPDGDSVIVWECVPDTATVWDGGFQTKNLDIDKNSAYVFVCWVKKSVGNTGKVYYATNNVTLTTGEEVRNANFIGAGSIFNTLDAWHTLVGYIYPENYVDDIEADVKSGLYFNGEKIQDGVDFKWNSDATNTSFRLLLNNSKDEKERLQIYNPQFYKVDGTEPKLYSLL